MLQLIPQGSSSRPTPHIAAFSRSTGEQCSPEGRGPLSWDSSSLCVMLCWALGAVPCCCSPEALGDGGMEPDSPPLALICCCAATSLAAAYSC